MDQLSVVVIGGFTCPNWTHHTLNVFAINFIPLAWKAWHLDGSESADYQTRLREIADTASTLLAFFLVGTVFNGMLCVERRSDWLQEISSKARRSRSRTRAQFPSHSRSRSRSRSSSPGGTKIVECTSAPESATKQRRSSLSLMEE